MSESQLLETDDALVEMRNRERIDRKNISMLREITRTRWCIPLRHSYTSLINISVCELRGGSLACEGAEFYLPCYHSALREIKSLITVSLIIIDALEMSDTVTDVMVTSFHITVTLIHSRPKVALVNTKLALVFSVRVRLTMIRDDYDTTTTST